MAMILNSPDLYPVLRWLGVEVAMLGAPGWLAGTTWPGGALVLLISKLVFIELAQNPHRANRMLRGLSTSTSDNHLSNHSTSMHLEHVEKWHVIQFAVQYRLSHVLKRPFESSAWHWSINPGT